MKFKAESGDLFAIKADLAAIGVIHGKFEDNALVKKFDQKMGGAIIKSLKREKFEGKIGQTKFFNTYGKLPQSYVAIVGLGNDKSYTLEGVRRASASLIKQAKALHLPTIAATLFGGLAKIAALDAAQAQAEGAGLATYTFTRYKALPKDATTITQFSVVGSPKELNEIKKGVARGDSLSRGVFFARDLINTTAMDMTPLKLAASAQGLKGVATRVYKLAEIKKLKMGALIGVGMGAANPPAFIEMHYKPAGKAKKSIALVGKGVTFDSGGLSIKPAKSMETMKDDMSGAAAVIGLMSVIHELKPDVEVWGYVAAAENAVDANAQRPGDIVTAINGKTIEVLNTDAEGRLTLADAIGHAIKKKPDYIVDVATLTGACLAALGDRYSAILGNDEKLVNILLECGKKTGELMWELPLVEEYREELKSTISDLKNIGGPYGGTINGALFIEEFVGGCKWAHLDIAGPSWTEKPRDYEMRGGTGSMVRAFAEFLTKV